MGSVDVERDEKGGDALLNMFDEYKQTETETETKVIGTAKKQSERGKTKRGRRGRTSKNKRQKRKKTRKRSGKNVRKNEEVSVYRFDAQGQCDAKEQSMGEEDELNERVIELLSVQSVLFPDFADFESWIGGDLLKLYPQMQSIVTSLREK